MGRLAKRAYSLFPEVEIQNLKKRTGVRELTPPGEHCGQTSKRPARPGRFAHHRSRSFNFAIHSGILIQYPILPQYPTDHNNSAQRRNGNPIGSDFEFDGFPEGIGAVDLEEADLTIVNKCSLRERRISDDPFGWGGWCFQPELFFRVKRGDPEDGLANFRPAPAESILHGRPSGGSGDPGI